MKGLSPKRVGYILAMFIIALAPFHGRADCAGSSMLSVAAGALVVVVLVLCLCSSENNKYRPLFIALAGFIMHSMVTH